MTSSKRDFPNIVALGCQHATAAELGERSAIVPCAGRLDVSTVLRGFADGAEGVVILSCPASECRHRRCEEEACEASGAAVASKARSLLATAGISPKRVVHRAVARGEDGREVLAEAAGAIGELGPWSRALPPCPDSKTARTAADRCAWINARMQAALEPSTSRHVTVDASGDLLWLGCDQARRLASGEVTADEVSPALELWRRGKSSGAIIGGRCCGAALLEQEDKEVLALLARDNVELLQASGAKRVVTACGGCADIFRQTYREIGLSIEAEILTLEQWAAESLSATDRELKIALVGENGAEGELQRALLTLLPAAASVVHLEEPRDALGQPLSGSASRLALEQLSDTGRRLGAEALVVADGHLAQRWRLVQGSGGWQTATRLPVYDVASVLEMLTSPAAGSGGRTTHDVR